MERLTPKPSGIKASKAIPLEIKSCYLLSIILNSTNSRFSFPKNSRMAIKSAINKTHFKCNQNKDYRLVSMQSETQNRNISKKVWTCCKKNNFKHCLNYKGEHEIQLRVWLYSFPPFGYMIKPSQVKNGKESFNSQILVISISTKMKTSPQLS